MGVHNNIHIPDEAWPHWTWYAMEFAIVVAVAFVSGKLICDSIVGDVAVALGHGAALESFEGITIFSKEFIALPLEIKAEIEGFLNWIFYSIVGGVFLAWYIIIRGFILKKKILSNRL